MNTGEKIKQARKAKGITQRQLAEKCGMKESAIGRIETKNPSVRTDTLTKIAHALEVDPRELMPDRAVEVIGNYVFEGSVDSAADLAQIRDMFSGNIKLDIHSLAHSRISAAESILNDSGLMKLADYAEDLTRIPEYTKKD